MTLIGRPGLHRPDGRSWRMAEMMLAELFRRRVFTPAETPKIEVPSPIRVPAAADAACGQPSIAF